MSGDLDPSFLDSPDKFLDLFRCCGLQESLDRERRLADPFELRAFRVIVRLFAEVENLSNVIAVPLEDFGLEMRVADVGVRVLDDIDFPLPRGSDRHLGFRFASVRLQLKGCGGWLLGIGQLELVGAPAKG